MPMLSNIRDKLFLPKFIQKARSSEFANLLIADVIAFIKSDNVIRYIKENGAKITISREDLSVSEWVFGEDGINFGKTWHYPSMGYTTINSWNFLLGVAYYLHQQVTHEFSYPYMVSNPKETETHNHHLAMRFTISFTMPPEEKPKLKSW